MYLYFRLLIIRVKRSVVCVINQMSVYLYYIPVPTGPKRITPVASRFASFYRKINGTRSMSCLKDGCVGVLYGKQLTNKINFGCL